jgi:hypothetical protein
MLNIPRRAACVSSLRVLVHIALLCLSASAKQLNNRNSIPWTVTAKQQLPDHQRVAPGGAISGILKKQTAKTNDTSADGVVAAAPASTPPQLTSTSSQTPQQSLDQVNSDAAEAIIIRKRDGSYEALDDNKVSTWETAESAHEGSQQIILPLSHALTPSFYQILTRLTNLSLDLKYVNIPALAESIVRGMYPNVTSGEIDTLAAETSASMSTQHPEYSALAARISISHNHKVTPNTFAEAIDMLYTKDQFIHKQVADLVKERAEEINARVNATRDFSLTYFGFKTLERAYLLKTEEGNVIERPQYLMMRVALGIHCVHSDHDGSKKDMSKEAQDECLQAAFETYDMMSQGYFTHASPTLFHAGTTHPQLSSCFLLQMSEDSINGIYDTLKRCAVISKAAGGIGLSVHNIRARGTHIAGTRGVSNGLVPMLRVFDVTSRYVDQGGGKRPGAFAIYVEPWHADIFDVLNLKKNHGKEEQRARDLFYGLWVPDLFMERVEKDGMWSLMCPHQCPGLQRCHGDEFRALYKQYEAEGKFVKQIRARDLWGAILDAQIETGTPYLLYKDAANEKSNQKNLGTIQSSNLCTEIIQYTDNEEIAVCNLASM